MTSKDYEDSSAEESSFLDTHLQLLPKGGGLDTEVGELLLFIYLAFSRRERIESTSKSLLRQGLDREVSDF